MGTTKTPLYDALVLAISAYEASDDWDADGLPEIAAMYAALPDDAGPDTAAWRTYSAAWGLAWSAYRAPFEAAMDAAREALAKSDEPREYTIRYRDGSGVEDTIISTPREIEAAVADHVLAGDWSCDEEEPTTAYIDVAVTCIDGYDDPQTITIDVPEPDCDSDNGHGHDWRSPWSVVGGLKENPGVRGHGGGTICTEVCAHCGRYRISDSWAQRHDTGEQGLDETTYRAADDESLAYVERCAAKLREAAAAE